MIGVNVFDIMLDDEGDFALNDQRELKVANENDLLAQVVAIVLRTVGHGVGADLEDLIGRPNTKETAEEGKKKIRQALIKTTIFSHDDLFVDAKPVGVNAMVFFLFVRSPFQEDPLSFAIHLDVGSEVTVRRMS